MEKDTLQIQIDGARENLPKTSSLAIEFVQWKAILALICKKNKYSIEQIDALETETELLLVGLMNPDNYAKEIEDRVKIKPHDAELLVGEINRAIFEKIKEQIIAFGGSKIETKNENSGGYKKKIYEIGTKYKLPIDVMGEVEEATGKFLNGGISSSQYEDQLSLITDLPMSKISLIINDINEQIVKGVRKEVIMGGETITNDQLLITDESEELPLPPYKVIGDYRLLITDDNKMEIEDELPLPPSIFTNDQPTTIANNNVIDFEKEISGAEKIETSENPNTEITTENKEMGANEFDLYKKDGIEVIGENPVSKNAESIKSGFEKSRVNILAEKLAGPVATKITVSDYSIPKMTPQIQPSPQTQNIEPSKPHDPYHETI